MERVEEEKDTYFLKSVKILPMIWCDFVSYFESFLYNIDTNPLPTSVGKVSYNIDTNPLPVQFSHSVVSNSLQPHEPQHTRPPCPSTTQVHPNPCPLSRWCHPTISSSVIPFSCPQSFPASASFPMSQLFTCGGQSIGVSASTSVPPMNTQDWSPLGRTGWISLQSKGLSRIFNNAVQKHQFFSAQLSIVQLSHPNSYMTTGKTIVLTRWTFVGKVMSLLFNMLYS